MYTTAYIHRVLRDENVIPLDQANPFVPSGSTFGNLWILFARNSGVEPPICTDVCGFALRNLAGTEQFVATSALFACEFSRPKSFMLFIVVV